MRSDGFVRGGADRGVVFFFDTEGRVDSDAGATIDDLAVVIDGDLIDLSGEIVGDVDSGGFDNFFVGASESGAGMDFAVVWMICV